MDTQAVRIIVFKGDEASWRTWKNKVLAYALQKGFRNALLTQEDLVAEEDIDSPDTTESQKKAYNTNLIQKGNGNSLEFIDHSNQRKGTIEIQQKGYNMGLKVECHLQNQGIQR